MEGIRIDWTVEEGGGSLDRAMSVTGPDGSATVAWTLGPSTGQQQVSAGSGTTRATFAAEAGIVGPWERVADLPHGVRASAASTDGERVYVFGGSADAGPRTRHTQIYDPASNQWSLGAAIPKAVEWSTVVYASNRFHLMGGVTDETAATDEHWIYDPVGDAWIDGPPLPAPAAGSASGLLGGEIIVAAGIDGPGAYSDNVHLYSPSAEAWSTGPNTPSKLINWQGAVLGGHFYAAGGSGPGRITSATFLRYDPTAQTWSTAPSMAEPNEGYAATGFLGFYCLVGGRVTPVTGSFNTSFDRFECFDPAVGHWIVGPGVPLAAQEMGAASVGGFYYAIGGRPSPSAASNHVYRIGPGRPMT